MKMTVAEVERLAGAGKAVRKADPLAAALAAAQAVLQAQAETLATSARSSADEARRAADEAKTAAEEIKTRPAPKAPQYRLTTTRNAEGFISGLVATPSEQA